MKKNTKSPSDKKSPKSNRKRFARAFLETACNLYEIGEREESIRLFKLAASLGSLEAQVNLANIYDNGDGLSINPEMARYWYKRAVRGGSHQAAYNLGISYLDSNDLRWAIYWLKKAHELGDEDAEEQLSLLKNR